MPGLTSQLPAGKRQLLGLAVWSVLSLGCSLPLWGQAPTEASNTAASNESSGGDRYLTEVLAAQERRTNLSAKLRYRARLDEHTLMGTGNYWQRGVGTQRVTRWEMQTQVAGKTASYVQVFDGNHLWTDRHLPSSRQVHRLDVQRLQTRLNSMSSRVSPRNRRKELLQETEYRGGLSQILAELLKRFEFAPAKTAQLNGLGVDALVGHWRPEQLRQLWPDMLEVAGVDTAVWPEQIPHHVLVLVGQNNLFPYVIEYRRREDAYLSETLTGLKPSQDPLLRYEIFEVNFAAAIDSTLFEFKPGDVQWSDETNLVLERLVGQRQAAQDSVASEKGEGTTR